MIVRDNKGIKEVAQELGRTPQGIRDIWNCKLGQEHVAVVAVDVVAVAQGER